MRSFGRVGDDCVHLGVELSVRDGDCDLHAKDICLETFMRYIVYTDSAPFYGHLAWKSSLTNQGKS